LTPPLELRGCSSRVLATSTGSGHPAHGEVRRTIPSGETVVAEGDDATCFYYYVLVFRHPGVSSLARRRAGLAPPHDQPHDHVGVLLRRDPVLPDHRPGATSHVTARLSKCDHTPPTLGSSSGRRTDFGAAAARWFTIGDAAPARERPFPRNAERQRRGETSGSGCSRSARCPAGLTHELTTPRAPPRSGPPPRLRERSPGCGTKELPCLPTAGSTPLPLPALVNFRMRRSSGSAKAPKLGPIEASDAEDDSATGWTSTGSAGGWDSAPVLVQLRPGRSSGWRSAAVVYVARRRLPGRRSLAGITVETEIADERDRGRHHPPGSTLVGGGPSSSQWRTGPGFAGQSTCRSCLKLRPWSCLARKIG